MRTEVCDAHGNIKTKNYFNFASPAYRFALYLALHLAADARTAVGGGYKTHKKTLLEHAEASGSLSAVRRGHQG